MLNRNVRQRKTNTYITYMEYRKYNWWIQQKRSRLTDIENKVLVTNVWGGPKYGWECGRCKECKVGMSSTSPQGGEPLFYKIYACMLMLQSCPTLCESHGLQPPGSSVHGILQARILEWVAMPYSRGSSWPRDRTWVSHIVSRFFTAWATWEAPKWSVTFKII